ncbi:MAG: hypothetical protein AAGI01_18760 [Myxococcota bacterium]
MPWWLMAALGVVAIVLEGGLLQGLGAEGVALQWGVGVVLFLGLRRRFLDGALLAALMFPFIEWTSGAPAGLASLSALTVFLAAKGISRALERRWGLAQLVVCGLTVVVSHAVTWVLLALSGAPPQLRFATLATLPMSVFASGLGIFALGLLFDRIDKGFDARRASDDLLFRFH